MPSSTLTPSLWETVKCDFKSLFPEDVFQMWFEPVVCMETTEDAMTLGVPNDFAAIWIHDNYLDLITQRLRLTAGRMVNVTLRKTDSSTRAGLPAANGNGRAHLEAAAPTSRVKPAAPRRTLRYDERGPTPGTLNPRNTFETYVVGSNNQMAHAASMAVAQAPAQAYNPLFLYGETGLGKTHLMHAIGHAIIRHNADARVAYLSTEKFTNEFIQALQENSLTRFRQRYRNADVLLLDDVQFLTGKERIQEEFFHTFNDLFESGKQIVLTSDRRASEIQKLEARLVSRFEWGLPADIQAPDLETRLAILRTKAQTLNCNLPEPILNFIAQNITRNIRRLEGALLKVSSYSALTSKPLDLATAERLLQDVLMEQAQNILTIETIQKRVADHFQIRHSDMTSKRRPNNIAIPRQIAMFITRTLTKHSLQEIGDAFGGRDHGTVIHACKAVDNMMEQDAVSNVLSQFLHEGGNQSGLGVGAESYIRNMLTEALGEERARGFLDRILLGGSSSGINSLKWMDSRSVADVIRNEHPQIQAVVLSYLEPDQSASILGNFPEKVRTEIMMRIASLESVQPDALKELNMILEKQFSGKGSNPSTTIGGTKTAAEIMNNLDGSVEQELMQSIKDLDEDLGNRIQDLMFVFDNLRDVDDRGIQSLLREVSSEVLILALKGADDFLKEKFFANMSKRAAELLRDDLEAKGPVRIVEVEAAQKEILVVARRMADAGEIQLGGGGEAMI